MFEKYFVTCNVAIALQAAGFNEPCMAVYECYEINGKHVEFLNISITPDSVPISELQPWCFAAPLYQQVFEWLFKHNIRVHVVYIAKAVAITHKDVWHVSLIDATSGDNLWPGLTFKSTIDESGNITWDVEGQTLYQTEREAWEAALKKAIELTRHQSPTI